MVRIMVQILFCFTPAPVFDQRPKSQTLTCHLKVLRLTFGDGYIGVGRFRIFGAGGGGGQGLEYLGAAKGGGQIFSRHMTS